MAMFALMAGHWCDVSYLPIRLQMTESQARIDGIEWLIGPGNRYGDASE